MGVAALAATLFVWSATLNSLVKRKIKLSLFLLLGYVALHVVFVVRPELGGAAVTDAASPIRPFERLALTAAVINLLVIGLINPLRSDRVRDRFRVATTLGFGPRFLHSTGQAHKGGPGSGVFLQLTCEDAEVLEVPGQRASFGVVKAAQARGDFQVLADRNRRALRVHLKGDLHAALAGFDAALAAALA